MGNRLNMGWVNGDLVVADALNCRVCRVVAATGAITTIAES
jgi:hypothetical protein